MTFKKYQLFKLLLTGCVSAFLIIACNLSHKNDQSDTGLLFEISKQPFALTVNRNGKRVVAKAGGESVSAFFYITEKDTQYITNSKEIITDSTDHFKAIYQTTDNREAEIDIYKKENGIISLHFSVVPSTGIIRKGISFKSYEGEAYYGLMERTVDGDQQNSWTPGIKEGLDLRGQKLTMFTKPTLGIYTPFYISSRGYGLFVNGSWPGDYDLAKSDSTKVSLSFEGPALDISLIPGPKPVDVIKQFSKIVTPSILPPKWAFSVFHWRDDHSQRDTLYDGTPNTSPYNADVVEDILMLDAFDIPNGVYWIDRPWAQGPEGYSDFKWDTMQFPHPEKMVDWLHRKDQKLLLWIAPWIMGDEMFAAAKQKGYLIPGSYQKRSGEPSQLLDFTNPEAVSWWGGYMKRVLDDGVDGFKLDRSEEIMPDSPGIILHNGKTARQIHNQYPMLYLKGTYAIMKKHRPDGDFLLMPRAAYTNSRVYGVFWGGDIHAGPWGLRTALIAVQRAAFMGYPFWGSDTGGYWGKESDFTHENLCRWLAFSCFTPIMEVGPLRNGAVWNMPYQPSYDTTLIAAYRLYATMHTRLINYTYKMAQIAHHTGMPIVRPMAMAFPDDKKAVEHWDEYLYGPDILVGIIWQNGQQKFDIYLPEGNWIDAWSGKKYTGMQTVSVACPLPKIPVFIRADSDVELGDLNKLYQQSLEIARNKPDLHSIMKRENF